MKEAENGFKRTLAKSVNNKDANVRREYELSVGKVPTDIIWATYYVGCHLSNDVVSLAPYKVFKFLLFSVFFTLVMSDN